MLIVCDVCSSIDNTALTCFAQSPPPLWKDESLNGKVLCSACTPEHYADGTACAHGGKWHGLFERVVATEKKLLMRLDHFVYLGPKFEHLRKRQTAQAA